MTSPEIVPLPLVTLLEAKRHLRLDGDIESPLSETYQEAESKILQASHIVMDYIKRPADEWDDVSAPPLIKAAVLLVMNVLYDHPEDDPITVGVRSILHRYRDPALA